MAQTLLEVREQIAKLQQDEARLKKVEAAGVISRIKVAIEAYGFAPEDLFDMDGYAKSRPSKAPSARTTPAAAPAPTVARAATKTKAKPASQPSATARYADGAAKEWSGRGPRPLWLRSAIEGGRATSGRAAARSPVGSRKP
jgi:DNA-binding protein H-NS